MDDEECIPENGNLKAYLQSLGYDDFQVKKSTPSTGIIKFDHLPSRSSLLNEELIEEEVIQQIGILISTRMLFEEDVKNIENLLSNFKAQKLGMLKNMFQGLSGITAIFLGLLLYWIMGGYAFFIGSTFYAYKAADYLWKKNYNQARVKKLASVLQSNYALITKTVKFIKENNKFIQCKDFNGDCHSEENVGFDIYSNFKSDFYASLIDMIDILINSTKKLIVLMPLCEYVENPKYYICNNFNTNSQETTDLFKLYQIYLLVQSEFLQRFILSLIPNLNLTKYNNFQVLNKVVTECCVKLLKVKNNLNKKFKFVFFNGIHNMSLKTNFNGPCRSRAYSSCYEEELASNIHDVSNTFQNLLIKSRIIEDNLKTNKAPKDLENDLINIQTELNSCQRNISDGFILLKKASGEKENNKTVKVTQHNDEQPEEKHETVQVGYTDFNPSIEDEIFEAYFADGDVNGDLPNYDDWDIEEKIKKKLQKEFSQNVIKELKMKLVEKVKEREKREAEILSRNKCGFRDSEKTIDLDKKTKDLFNQSIGANDVTETNQAINLENCPKIEDKEKYSQLHPQKCTEKIKSDLLNGKQVKHVLVRENNLIERNSVTNVFPNENFQQNCFGLVNKNFLSDISLARQRILQTSPVEEQCYCDSDQSSEETDLDK